MRHVDFCFGKSQWHASPAINADFALKDPARSSRQAACDASQAAFWSPQALSYVPSIKWKNASSRFQQVQRRISHKFRTASLTSSEPNFWQVLIRVSHKCKAVCRAAFLSQVQSCVSLNNSEPLPLNNSEPRFFQRIGHVSSTSQGCVYLTTQCCLSFLSINHSHVSTKD